MWPYRKCDASENDDRRRARRQSRLSESQRVIFGTLLSTENTAWVLCASTKIETESLLNQKTPRALKGVSEISYFHFILSFKVVEVHTFTNR